VCLKCGVPSQYPHYVHSHFGDGSAQHIHVSCGVILGKIFPWTRGTLLRGRWQILLLTKCEGMEQACACKVALRSELTIIVVTDPGFQDKVSESKRP
jgi:thiamine phosphate synthase YjbQ (UPF0047 family)